MQITTMSVVVGSAACNARCPFCVSKMTVPNGVTVKADAIDFRNWKQAIRLAQVGGVTTVLLTGKGEPTLFPVQLQQVLDMLNNHTTNQPFPIIELQTNGIPIADGKITDEQLEDWFDRGLRTIAISNVGIDTTLNNQIYLPYKDKYIDLVALINRLHKFRFSVRLATVMIRGGVDTVDKVTKLIEFAKEHKVEQLKICPVTKPKESDDKVTLGWVQDNHIVESQIYKIKEFIEQQGTLLQELPHGANVYDVWGQNICLANCLTVDRDPNKMRQIIYFPDGSIRYSWEHSGARIL